MVVVHLAGQVKVEGPDCMILGVVLLPVLKAGSTWIDLSARMPGNACRFLKSPE